jgi:hypothetical protein
MEFVMGGSPDPNLGKSAKECQETAITLCAFTRVNRIQWPGFFIKITGDLDVGNDIFVLLCAGPQTAGSAALVEEMIPS